MSDDVLTDAQLVRQLFRYDPETGILLHKRLPFSKLNNKPAGHVLRGRHRLCSFKGKQILSRNIIWLYMRGVWPDGKIKHINGDTLDERFANLAISRVERTPGNKSGYTGVSFHAYAKRWVAQIRIKGKKRHLGYFDTPEEAHQAYVEAANKRKAYS